MQFSAWLNASDSSCHHVVVRNFLSLTLCDSICRFDLIYFPFIKFSLSVLDLD
jgi:hypothetical protein